MTTHISQLPASSADHAKYTVHGHLQIAAILGALYKSGRSITAYIDGVGEDFILTSIVAVKPEQNTVLLDYGANAVANMRAMAAKKIICVTTLDGIRIQMNVESFHPERFEGRRVFAMTMPETLLRLQRREYYRVNASRSNPLLCIIAPSEVLAGMSGEMVIDDISCGGIALVLPRDAANIETGTRFKRCRIPLPDMAEATNFGALTTNFGTLYGGGRRTPLPESLEVTTDLVVRGTVEITFANGVKHRHVGCEFTNMRETDRALIQRYISKIEHERRYQGTTR